MSKYAPDLAKHRFYVWLNNYHWVPVTISAILTLAIGGWRILLWTAFFRIAFGLHATWLVNSATHMWGTQRFDTGDTSMNSFWVAVLTFGEGWHNNHHAQPQSARHGFTWWELDVNWYGIWALRTLGLAWDVKMPKMSAESVGGRLAA